MWWRWFRPAHWFVFDRDSVHESDAHRTVGGAFNHIIKLIRGVLSLPNVAFLVGIPLFHPLRRDCLLPWLWVYFVTDRGQTAVAAVIKNAFLLHCEEMVRLLANLLGQEYVILAHGVMLSVREMIFRWPLRILHCAQLFHAWITSLTELVDLSHCYPKHAPILLFELTLLSWRQLAGVIVDRLQNLCLTKAPSHILRLLDQRLFQALQLLEGLLSVNLLKVEMLSLHFAIQNVLIWSTKFLTDDSLASVDIHGVWFGRIRPLLYNHFWQVVMPVASRLSNLWLYVLWLGVAGYTYRDSLLLVTLDTIHLENFALTGLEAWV